MHCTDTLTSWLVSSCQPRFMLPPSTDVLKYKLVKGCNLVPFFVTLHFLKHVLIVQSTYEYLAEKTETMYSIDNRGFGN